MYGDERVRVTKKDSKEEGKLKENLGKKPQENPKDCKKGPGLCQSGVQLKES